MVLLCCEVNRLIVRLSSSQTQKSASASSTSLGCVSLLQVFFFGRWKISQTFEPQYPKNLNILSGLVHTTEPQWQKPLSMVVNRVVVGSFEEEEERIDIASDVVKVGSEDPATPGCRDRVRTYVGDSGRTG